MEPPLPARRPDDAAGESGFVQGQDQVAYDVGEFQQGSPFSRWALARYVVGRVILERVSWSLLAIALVLLVLAAAARFLIDSTFLAVLIGIIAVFVLILRAVLRAVLRRLMGAAAYGPIEARLSGVVNGASGDIFAELRRVGLPSRVITIPLILLRLIGRRRGDTLARMKQFEVERAVSRARVDELHMLIREASGSPRPPAAGAA